MNEVKKARFRGELSREIREIAGEFIYEGMLKQSLDNYKAQYLQNNSHEVSPDDEEKFLSTTYVTHSARSNTNEIIDELVDKLVPKFEKYYQPSGLSIFQRVLTGGSILLSVHILFLYAWIGYSYLNGTQEALKSITYFNVIEAFVCGGILLVLFIAACVHEWKDRHD